MARSINRLNSRSPVVLKDPGLHADGGGLYLRIDKGGAKRWVFIFRWRGKRTEMGLGSLTAVGLGEARKKAQDAREAVARGQNPIELRKAGQAVPTFGEVADDLLASMEGQWKNAKHRYQWKVSLERHAKPIRAKAVDQVTTDDVLRLLKPLWSKINETASRTRGRIERVLDAARARGVIASPWENPARWKGHLDLLLPRRRREAKEHHPAMAAAAVPAFMVELKARPALAARALELTILTAARTGETIGARREEFDLVGKLWTVPAGRMKAGREHRIPLSAAAVRLVADLFETLEIQDKPDALVFPGPDPAKPISNMAMLMLLRRMGHADITVHGFRSTFKDWAADSTGFANDLVEVALAHRVGDETEQAYRRGDALEKRRRLMEAWSRFCNRDPGDNVRVLTPRSA